MASRSALIALLVAVSCAAAASAVQYTVGESQGWNTNVDYSSWLSGKNFKPGDELVFTFPTGAHDVAEVDKSGYDGCSGSSSQNTFTTGPATVNLTSGTHYYICTISTHCSSGGMKLAVNVGSGSGSPTTPPAPGAPNTPTPTPNTPSPPKNGASARTAAPVLAVAAGVLLKLALF